MIPRKTPEVGDLWIMSLEDPTTGLDKELLVELMEETTDDHEGEERVFWVRIGRNEWELDNCPIQKEMMETWILERCYLPRM